MLVLWKNNLYQLEMPFLLFESWKEHHKERTVEILQLTDSSYKKQEIVKIEELEDWSVARNLQALGRN